MFRASLCPSSGEQDVCYCMCCAALLLLDVVGSGCGALPCGVRALWRLLFDIMMPETCWEIVKNKHLTVASCWFSLSLHNLLTMHGHRNLKRLQSSSYANFPLFTLLSQNIFRNISSQKHLIYSSIYTDLMTAYCTYGLSSLLSTPSGHSEITEQ